MQLPQSLCTPLPASGVHSLPLLHASPLMLLPTLSRTRTHAKHTLSQVGLLIYWVAVSALMYSSGTLTPKCRDPNAFTVSALALCVCVRVHRHACAHGMCSCALCMRARRGLHASKMRVLALAWL